MRLSQDTRVIERVALGHERGFSIKATSKAFKILSSGLYRDKILAIVRELACNAYDAHVAAGWPERPFQVHLPNILEPFFAVRDWGVGLSPEAITSVYTTYFESDKTTSNAYIGALGLGSKSPFSYVDSFTVCSWHGGVCSRYAAFIAEQGEPVISLMSQVPSNEPNGVEVSLPVVQPADFVRFIDKAQHVLARFAPRPMVLGCAAFTFVDPEVLLHGDGWRVTTRACGQGPADTTAALAIMGNVAYPISLSAMAGFDALTQRIYEVGMEIDFPIGSLDVTAGRENLSYDSATLAALQRRAQVIAEEAPARMQQMFDACPSRYAAHRLYGRLFLGRIAPRLLADPSLLMRFRGEIIDTSTVPVDLKAFPMVTVDAYTDARSKYRKRTYSSHLHDRFYMPTEGNVVLMIDDLHSSTMLRSRIALQRKTDPQQLLIVLCGPPTAVQPIRDRLDGFATRLASTLPRPPAPVRRSTTPIWQITRRVFAGQVQLDDTSWSSCQIDPAQGGFYVPKRAHVVLRNERFMRDFARVLHHAVDLKLFDPATPIYGFNAKLIQRYVDKPHGGGVWINLLDHIKSLVLARLTGPALDASTLARMQVRALLKAHGNLSAARPMALRLGQALPPDHPLARFSRVWEQGRGPSAYSDERLRALCEFLNIALPATITALARQWADFSQTYPLLAVLQPESSHRPIPADVAHLAAYVQWVDAGAGMPSPACRMLPASQIRQPDRIAP